MRPIIQIDVVATHEGDNVTAPAVATTVKIAVDRFPEKEDLVKLGRIIGKTVTEIQNEFSRT